MAFLSIKVVIYHLAPFMFIKQERSPKVPNCFLIQIYEFLCFWASQRSDCFGKFMSTCNSKIEQLQLSKKVQIWFSSTKWLFGSEVKYNIFIGCSLYSMSFYYLYDRKWCISTLDIEILTPNTMCEFFSTPPSSSRTPTELPTIPPRRYQIPTS